MIKKTLMMAVLIALFFAGNVFAMMGGTMGSARGGMTAGSPGGMMSGSTVQGTNNSRMSGGGMGSGMLGAGGMASGMMKNTMTHGYLDVITPLTTSGEALTAIQAFIDASNSKLHISELWEYETVYKAELSDINRAKALDLLADKVTGAVMPEMGLSMMMNASYGKSLYNMVIAGRKLIITPDQATELAQEFIDSNTLPYTLGEVEIYPGFYKFHTQITDSSGNFGLDIMVNGYNGKIWMDTLLSFPVGEPQLFP